MIFVFKEDTMGYSEVIEFVQENNIEFIKFISALSIHSSLSNTRIHSLFASVMEQFLASAKLSFHL